MRRSHLVVVAPTMGMGGAERCVATLLSHFDRRLFRLSLILLFDRDVFYSIPPDVKVISLQSYSRSRPSRPHSSGIDLPDSLAHARSDLEWMESTAAGLADLLASIRPDIILARHVYSSMLCAMSMRLTTRRSRLVLSVDNHMSTMLPRIDHGSLYARLLPELLNAGDRVIALCEALADDLATNFRVDPAKLVVIPNPVDLTQLQLVAREHIKHPWFGSDEQVVLSVGRLVKQKGFDDLVRAVGIIHRRGLRPRLVLVGDGPEREALEMLAEAQGLKNHAWITGPTTNPFRYLSRGTVFVLSSHHEGFGNVIVEALASGCPVVSTDCPCGPSEILRKETGPMASWSGLPTLRSWPVRSRESCSTRICALNSEVRDLSEHAISMHP